MVAPASWMHDEWEDSTAGMPAISGLVFSSVNFFSCNPDMLESSSEILDSFSDRRSDKS